MGNTVFADGMGLFHKGSGGKGVAPVDVCLTPPPPPAGPLPVPYVNMLQASDLAKGSKKVKIQGEPTALEDASNISTSTGNESATQGGGLVTHKTKGKGSFTLWSFTVKVESKGVCCNGHPMLQNTASTPPNIVCAAALVNANLAKHGFTDVDYTCTACEEAAFKRHAPKAAQKQRVKEMGALPPTVPPTPPPFGGGCWSCSKISNRGKTKKGNFYSRKKWTPDHQPPQKFVWMQKGGCKGACDDPPDDKKAKDKFKAWADDPDTCIPQCASCSSSQGGYCSHNDGSEAMAELDAMAASTAGLT